MTSFIHPRKWVRITKEFFHDFFWFYLLPDSWYYRIEYRNKTGEKLNLHYPHTLNEKIQWIKMYYRKSIMTLLADKYRAKEYIRVHIGEQYVVPTLAVYHSIDEIDWDVLPERFVIKCNHDSASNFFCKDKATFNKKIVKEKLDYFMHRNYYRHENKQWAYKNIPPVIMVEPYLQNPDGSEVVDYKFYCYGGELMYMMYSIGEAHHQVRNVKISPEGKLIDHYFKRTCQLKEEEIILPDTFKEMCEIARKEGKKFPHLRLDMYSIDGKVYVGEYTFYSNGGFINICSEEYAQTLADRIDIEKIKQEL